MFRNVKKDWSAVATLFTFTELVLIRNSPLTYEVPAKIFSRRIFSLQNYFPPPLPPAKIFPTEFHSEKCFLRQFLS